MPQSRRLTPTYIDKLKPFPDRDLFVGDSSVAGLALRIRPDNQRSWSLRYVSPLHKGITRRYTFVPPKEYRKWPLERVRAVAAELRAKIADGQDPLEPFAVDQSPDAPQTVTELAKRYLEHAANRPQPKRKRSLIDDQSMIKNLIAKPLGKLAPHEVTMEQVRELHQRVGGDTPYRANRMLSLLSAMFNFAAGMKWVEGNPARSSYHAKPGFIHRYQEESKMNWLKAEQLQQLDKALGKSSGAEAIRLLALTGSRSREVLQAKWTEIDLKQGTWLKPKERTKQGEFHYVPLSPQALAVLQRLHKKKSSSVFVFPKQGDPTQPRTSVKSVWIGALRRTGLAERVPVRDQPGRHRWKPLVRIHDLRHSYASNLVSDNVSLAIVGELLGHSRKANTTKRYAHLATEALQAATNKLGAMYAKKRKD